MLVALSFATVMAEPEAIARSEYPVYRGGYYGFGGKRNAEAQHAVKRSADYIFLCKMKRDAEGEPTDALAYDDANPPYYGHPEVQNVVKRSADYIFMCKI